MNRSIRLYFTKVLPLEASLIRDLLQENRAFRGVLSENPAIIIDSCLSIHGPERIYSDPFVS